MFYLLTLHFGNFRLKLVYKRSNSRDAEPFKNYTQTFSLGIWLAIGGMMVVFVALFTFMTYRNFRDAHYGVSDSLITFIGILCQIGNYDVNANNG